MPLCPNVSKMVELVVEGNVYLKTGLVKCCVGIEDGRIVALKKILKGDEHFDFGDKLVLPGGIDSHVHFREPGNEHKEDFTTGTMAAAFGGVTCVLDMPNTIPHVFTSSILMEKLQAIETKACIDFGLYAGVRDGIDVNSLAQAANAFKLYMAGTTDAQEILGGGPDLLLNLMKEISGSGKVLAVHAESENLINKSLDSKTLEDHLRARPSESEISAINTILKLAQNLAPQDRQNLKLHICHVSTQEAVGILKNFKSATTTNSAPPNDSGSNSGSSNPEEPLKKELLTSNFNLTSEVTPHHLFLNMGADKGAFCKVNPPLRTPDDQRALWDALIDGTIDILASDHAPHTIAEKEDNEFAYAPSGIPGVETMLPLLFPYLKHNKLPLERFVNAVCEQPSTIFGLNKGTIEEGRDADLIVVDLRQETEIKGDELHSKCGWTPYEGMTAVFPRMVMVRGEIIVKDDNLEGERGFGKFHR